MLEEESPHPQLTQVVNFGDFSKVVSVSVLLWEIL